MIWPATTLEDRKRPQPVKVDGIRSLRTHSAVWPFAAIIAIFSLLVLVREPQIILKGRIWAEDGIYLGVAVGKDFFQMMTFVKPGVGYCLLLMNLAAFVAGHCVPLEFAPYVFIGVGLLVQVLPLVLLLFSRVELRLTPVWFALIALCCLVAQPSEEIWLSTVGSPFLLSAAAAIILVVSPVRPQGSRWLARAVLAVGALTGLSTLLLTPLFVLRAMVERHRERIIQACILLFFGSFQLWALLKYGGTNGRHYLFSTDAILAALASNDLLLPLFGNGATQLARYVALVRDQIVTNHMNATTYFTLLGFVGLFAVAFYRLVKCSGRSECVFLLCSAVCLSVASIAGSLTGISVISMGQVDSRYFYTPNLLLTVVFVLAVAPGTALPRIDRLAAAAFLLWLLAVGSYEYFHISPWVYSGPSWKAELAAWRKSPSRPLRFSPSGPGDWSISLPGPADLPLAELAHNSLEDSLHTNGLRNDPVLGTILFAHPYSRFSFPVSSRTRAITVGFGILDGAWQSATPTDGVDFRITATQPSGAIQPLWVRVLDPVRQPVDRGPQTTNIAIHVLDGSRLIFQTTPGPTNRCDWAYWTNLQLSDGR